MEVPNSDEPFFNVEEGLKISYFTVYDRAQNRLYIGQKYHAKKMESKRIMKQVVVGSPKQVRTLNQTEK